MPNLPRLPKRKRERSNRKPTGSQNIYKRNAWRKFSYRYKLNNPLCEACLLVGKTTDVSPGLGNGAADHIIKLSRGNSAIYDERNIMTLCTRHHSIKSNYEGQGKFSFIKGERNEKGYLFPSDDEKNTILHMITNKSS